MKKFIFYLLLLSGTSLSVYSQQGYELTGIVPKELDGKKIYLSNQYTDYSKVEVPLRDSTIIINGRFRFAGKLNNPAAFVTVHLARPDFGFKQFFLENKQITLTVLSLGKSNNFDSCVLANATFQGQEDELNLAKSALRTKMGELYGRQQKEYSTASDSTKKSFDNAFRLLYKEETDIIVNFVKTHPDYYVSLFWFAYHVTDRMITNPDATLTLFNQLSPRMQALPEAQTVLARIKQKIAVSQSRILPEFAINDLSGKSYSAADFKGSYVLLDFWASWCGPCIAEFPRVKELNQQYKDKKFTILGISLDNDKSAWAKALDRHTLPGTQVSELKGWESSLAKNLDIKYIPQYYLVAPDGKIVLMEASFDQVRNYLDNAFKSQK